MHNVEILLKRTNLGIHQQHKISSKSLKGLPVLHCLVGDALWFLVCNCLVIDSFFCVSFECTYDINISCIITQKMADDYNRLLLQMNTVISISHVWKLLRAEDVHLHRPALRIGTHFLLTLETVVFLFHLLSNTSKPFSSLSTRLAHAARLGFFYKNALYKFTVIIIIIIIIIINCLLANMCENRHIYFYTKFWSTSAHNKLKLFWGWAIQVACVHYTSLVHCVHLLLHGCCFVN